MKKVFIYSLLVFLVATPALAQNAATSTQASAGTLITSVMEQVGYHAQNQVLTQLRDGIVSVAGLIYLGVLVSIILTVGLLGNYRAALWILVGPPIFIYMSGIEMGGHKNTAKGASVEWRFGAFKDKQVNDDQGKMLDESEVGNRTPAEVSFVFHKYNQLISELFQHLITVITNNDTRSQMMFMTRQRIQEEIFAQQADNPGYLSLGQHFMASCSREISYAAYVAEGLRDPAKKEDPYWQVAKDEYCRLFKENKAFPTGPWQDYLYSLGIYKGIHITKEQNESERRGQEDGLASCHLLWQGLMKGGVLAIVARLEEAASTAVPPQAWKVSGNKTFLEALDELEKQFTVVEEKRTTEEKQNTETVDCIAGGEEVAVDDSVKIISKLLAAFLIKKMVTTSPYADMLGRVSDRDHGILSDQTIPVGTEPQQKEASFRRQGEHQYSEARRFEALTLITILPYLQGMILYVLAVIYPFFCLMLLLPGQAGSFLIWMALWAWAKSWDVGWALVMVADEVLWELMPKTAFLNAESVIDGNNPVTMMQIAFDGDPSYNMATYWLLLSGMVSGVPVITANMILGAKKAVSGVLLSNFSAIADPFAAGAADRAAGSQGRVFTTRREAAASLEMIQKSVAGQTKMTRDAAILNEQAKGGLDELAKTAQTGKDNSDQQKAAELQARLGIKREILNQDNTPEPGGSKK